MTEHFEAFDDDDRPLGLVPRGEVHRLGLWHRSAHVFVFSTLGHMLLQKRVLHKDLYAGCWDYAVGEHLKPGESFADGAARGLQEELGLAAVPEPVGEIVRNTSRGHEGQVDREIQQAFLLLHDGPFRPDPAEVAELRYVTTTQLARWLRTPGRFTPWFASELARLDLMGQANALS